MKKWLAALLPFVGLALFVVILAKTGVARIADVFRSADGQKLVLAPLFIVAIIALRGARWKYLMRTVGIEYSWWRSATVWTIGFFAAAVTPAKVGDAVRAVYLREDSGRSFGEAFSTVFVDRLCDLLFVLLMGVVSVLVYSKYYIQVPSAWFVVGASAVILLLVYVVLNRKIMRAIVEPFFNALVPKKYKERFSITFGSFYDSLGVYGGARGGLALALLLTASCWAAIFSLAYYMTRVLGVGIDARYLILIMPIVTLVELIPVSVSGLGTRDMTVIYFFGAVGISSAPAVGFSIGYVLVGTGLTVLLGFFFWLRRPVRFGKSSS